MSLFNYEVNLIWVTPNAENIILKCARVSSSNPDSLDTKLINYCIKNSHWSIFEMSNMCIEITAPLYIITQIIRHKSFSFQMFSMRYQNKNKLSSDIIEPDFRIKHNTNRQSSFLTHPKNDEYKQEYYKIYSQINELYNKMISDNVACESARVILGVNELSRIYMNGNIRSWIHYLNVRLDEHTQKEHRLIAEKIKDIFKNQLPIIYNSVFNN